MKSFLLICIVAFISSAADARPIAFICEVSGDGVFGTLNGVPFSNSFTYVVRANTDNIAPIPELDDGHVVDNDSAEIAIDSLGTFELTEPTESRLVRHAFAINHTPPTQLSLFLLLSSDLVPWDMRSPLSIFSSLSTISSPIGGIPTSGGLLVFEGAGVDTKFTAIFIPEPSLICLCIGSFVLLGFRRRGYLAT